MSIAVREFCQNSGTFSGVLRPIYGEVSDVLPTLEIAASQPNMVDYLDLLNVADEREHADTLRLLSHLPSEMILGEYGDEVLTVVAGKTTNAGRAVAHADALDRVSEVPYLTMDRTRQWCSPPITRGRDIVSQYTLSRLLFNRALEQFDLPGALSAAHKGPDAMTPRRAARFALKPVSVGVPRFEGWIAGAFDEIAPDVQYPIWLDTPSGFVLTCKGRPQAVAGMAISAYSSEIMIHQLQGVRGRREGDVSIEHISSGGLTGLDWRHVMVGAVGHLAKAMNISTIGVRQGKKNVWLKSRWGQPPQLTPAAAETAYDHQARRLGFKQGIDGDWRRQLAS